MQTSPTSLKDLLTGKDEHTQAKTNLFHINPPVTGF